MKVVFTGCSDHQRRWGNNAGDTDKLEVGKVYEVQEVEVRSWHTKYYLEGFKGSFNSVCFDKFTDERIVGNDKEDV
jgi:L-ascorbate metabolism protein UlaG (beta-lactamase superfamily)